MRHLSALGERARNLVMVGEGARGRQGNQLLDSDLILNDGPPEEHAAPSGKTKGARVSALEVAGLDPWGTQLVVAACAPGRGPLLSGQGVYGLRRALAIAGSETGLTRLWEVCDDTLRGLRGR